MFLDSLMLLDDAHAYSATAFSTNTIDLGNVTPKRDIGIGEGLEIVSTVDVAADSTTGNETYQFDFVQSANADLTSPDVLASRIITAANLTAGKVVHLPVPADAITKRYIGLQMTLGGTTPTITLTSFLQPQSMTDARKDYAKGYTIS